MENNEAYKGREISFDYNTQGGISFKLRISGSSFLESYDENPLRAQRILSAHLCDALGDILAEGEIDSLLQEINIRAQQEKLSLIEKMQQEKKDRRN